MDEVIPVLIIPVLNRYDLLRDSINSIKFPVGEILVIDNGGSNNEVLETEFSNVRVLSLPSNLGMSASWNLGIKLYPHEKFWVFSSADNIYMEDSLERMYKESGEDKVVLSNSGFGFFSVGENIIRNVGLFDEYFYPIYFEDNDFADRIELSGFKITSSDIPVNDNDGSQTIKSDNKLLTRNHETFVENEKYYKSKVDSKNYECRGWDIDLRRKHEWMR